MVEFLYFFYFLSQHIHNIWVHTVPFFYFLPFFSFFLLLDMRTCILRSYIDFIQTPTDFFPLSRHNPQCFENTRDDKVGFTLEGVAWGDIFPNTKTEREKGFSFSPLPLSPFHSFFSIIDSIKMLFGRSLVINQGHLLSGQTPHRVHFLQHHKKIQLVPWMFLFLIENLSSKGRRLDSDSQQRVVMFPQVLCAS